MRLQLRKRIAWYNTVAVAITFAVVFMVIYQDVHRTSYRQLDETIRLESDEVLTNINWKGDSIVIYHMPEWEEAEHSQAELNPIFLQINGKRGNAVFRTMNLVNDTLHSTIAAGDELFFNDNIRNQHVRQGQFAIRNEFGSKIGILLIATPADATFRVLANLRLALLIAFPVLLVVIFLVTSLAARKGIAPVNNLIAATSGIDDSTIHTRLPLPLSKDEVHQLATTINELLDRVEGSYLQQKQFTADASHELRTPLSAIRGTLEVMIRKPHEPEYYEAKVAEVIKQTDRLDNLIGQLLQLARLDSGGVAMKNDVIVLSWFLPELLVKWKTPLQDREMRCETRIPEDIKLSGDPFFLGDHR
jgi:signal transduction histidine kinase